MAMQIDANVPAGNIGLERIDGDTVYLHPDLRDTQGNWFYWCFRIRGAAGRTLRFVFTAQEPLAARGPAVSFDHGATWRWLGRDAGGCSSFTYPFAASHDDVLFSMGMPYTQGHWQRFVESLPADPSIEAGTLCWSWKARAVELLRVGHHDERRRIHILVTARHHACEMLANYALEGLIQGAVADDDVGSWFRQNVDLLAVPFMDKDGVEDGDQGKNRQPHDHGRDYRPPSLYAETRTLQALVAGWLAGPAEEEAPAVPRDAVVLDLHCPWIYDGRNEVIFQPGVDDSRGWSEQQAFACALHAALRGPLPYDPANDLPFGLEWNTTENMGGGQSLPGWALGLPAVKLATVIELPYAQAGGVEVNAETARAFGRDIARGVMTYCLANAEP